MTVYGKNLICDQRIRISVGDPIGVSCPSSFRLYMMDGDETRRLAGRTGWSYKEADGATRDYCPSHRWVAPAREAKISE
jgi:hypothetical protein